MVKEKGFFLQTNTLFCRNVEVCVTLLKALHICMPRSLAAVRCSVLQCVAVCCSVLQCLAVSCSALQIWNLRDFMENYAHVYVSLSCCSALQCVAVRCSVLQCVVNMEVCMTFLKAMHICICESIGICICICALIYAVQKASWYPSGGFYIDS